MHMVKSGSKKIFDDWKDFRHKPYNLKGADKTGASNVDSEGSELYNKRSIVR